MDCALLAGRTNSRFSGDGYGYGWFLRNISGHDYATAGVTAVRCFMSVPELNLTVVMTSEDENPSARSGYRTSSMTC